MNYPQYRSLTSAQKSRRISQARSTQQDRKSHPLNNQKFPQQNFIQFIVKQNQKQIKLHTYRHKSNTKPKGVIFMFHGLNAHIGQGAHVARIFAEKGFTCVGFDHRGFGKSQGEKGLVESLEQHLDDSLRFIKIVMEQTKAEYNHRVLYFGMGLSMGGMTLYHLALRNPKLLDSVILMAPALMHNLPSFVPFVTKLISSILPNSTRLLPPFADRSNKNPNVTQYRKNDPYCFNNRAYLRTMNFIVGVMNESSATFKQFECPFVVIQGGLDKLVNPDVAFRLYDQANVKDSEKRLIFYENMWHGIWHQDQIWQILKQCLVWLQQRVKLSQNN